VDSKFIEKQAREFVENCDEHTSIAQAYKEGYKDALCLILTFVEVVNE
jgi:hypothetical protein